MTSHVVSGSARRRCDDLRSVVEPVTEKPSASTAPLSFVKRDVCRLEDRLNGVAVAGVDSNADARTQVYLFTIKIDSGLEAIGDAAAYSSGLCGAANAGHEYGKLVAADPNWQLETGGTDWGCGIIAE